MKILLVRPSVPKHTIGLKHIMICEPLELEYIAAGLDGHDLMIFDHLVETGFKSRIEEFKPDIVVSSCYKTGTNEVIKLFRYVKSIDINCITIVGGVHATVVPEDFADMSVDIIGLGDGTMLLPEIVDSLAKGLSLLGVPGIAIPIGDGKLLKTDPREYMPKPDDLPFPKRELVAHLQHKYYYLMHRPVATMKTTWGCWYKCKFCFTWKVTDGIPFSRSPESIAAELLTIQADEIYIVDDIFLINRSRLNKLADLITKHNIRKNYLCYSRADFIAENEDIIEKWSSLGLKSVFIGLEATTDEELLQMNKNLDANHNIRAIEILRKYEIDIYASLIPGSEYDKEDWERLFKFIRDTKLYYVNISPATPLPGAEDYKDFREKLTVPEDAHGLFDLSHQLLPTRMHLRSYYMQLLLLYVKTTLNMASARKNTFRTLPSIWSLRYWEMIWGALKIGMQFINSHSHHSHKELRIAQSKGPKIRNLNFETKLNHSSFKEIEKKRKLDKVRVEMALEN